ncbi:unnamed protein product [Linum trigynum]|uniref:Secreted protein n=1 Tax=Linum trigynum TaxID=586398 RepID=A0AAV2FIE1_9ROSI
MWAALLQSLLAKFHLIESTLLASSFSSLTKGPTSNLVSSGFCNVRNAFWQSVSTTTKVRPCISTCWMPNSIAFNSASSGVHRLLSLLYHGRSRHQRSS